MLQFMRGYFGSMMTLFGQLIPPFMVASSLMLNFGLEVMLIECDLLKEEKSLYQKGVVLRTIIIISTKLLEVEIIFCKI